MNMVGHPKHIAKALAVGVDIICAQAGEGGGHTGDVPFSVSFHSIVLYLDVFFETRREGRLLITSERLDSDSSMPRRAEGQDLTLDRETSPTHRRWSYLRRKRTRRFTRLWCRGRLGRDTFRC